MHWDVEVAPYSGCVDVGSALRTVMMLFHVENMTTRSLQYTVRGPWYGLAPRTVRCAQA